MASRVHFLKIKKILHVFLLLKKWETLSQEKEGLEQFSERSKLITDPLKKTNLSNFGTQGKKVLSKNKTKVEILKEDHALFQGCT